MSDKKFRSFLDCMFRPSISRRDSVISGFVLWLTIILTHALGRRNITRNTRAGFWDHPIWPVVYHLFSIFWFADFFYFLYHLLQLPLRKKKQQKRRDSMSSIIENYDLNTPEKILKRRFDNAEDAEKIIEFITKDCFQIRRSTLIGWS